ncbi:hypothetical protein L1D94_15200 [Vibrio alginolyticus]|uniref:hypothetical protein n=1 Tax=Vibrio alginolyticus TaxID=663 RepID=UPI001EFEA408|nr:hypothetical protein [Vibrio alginolyticus]MCG9717969.1 hypothetical protein [Vibrio alginolyticus]
MKSNVVTLISLFSLATFSTLSHAADSNDHGVYVGANYGYLKLMDKMTLMMTAMLFKV